jgi:hypothetical protein
MSAILHEQAVDGKGCGLVSQEHPATDIVWCAAEVLQIVSLRMAPCATTACMSDLGRMMRTLEALE